MLSGESNGCPLVAIAVIAWATAFVLNVIALVLDRLPHFVTRDLNSSIVAADELLDVLSLVVVLWLYLAICILRHMEFIRVGLLQLEKRELRKVGGVVVSKTTLAGRLASLDAIVVP